MNKKQSLDLLKELINNTKDGPYVIEQISRKYVELKEIRKAIVELNESLGTIRIIMKYLLFDIEATRRERDKFRTILEDQN